MKVILRKLEYEEVTYLQGDPNQNLLFQMTKILTNNPIAEHFWWPRFARNLDSDISSLDD